MSRVRLRMTSSASVARRILHQLVDEILARLQRPQKLGELLAGAVEIVVRPLGLSDQLAPLAEQEFLLFRFEASPLL